MRDDGVVDTSAADAVWPTRLTGVNVVSNQENRTGAPSGLIVTGRGDAGFEPLDGEGLDRDSATATRRPDARENKWKNQFCAAKFEFELGKIRTDIFHESYTY